MIPKLTFPRSETASIDGGRSVTGPQHMASPQRDATPGPPASVAFSRAQLETIGATPNQERPVSNIIIPSSAAAAR